jgi:hypothetical protein
MKSSTPTLVFLYPIWALCVMQNTIYATPIMLNVEEYPSVYTTPFLKLSTTMGVDGRTSRKYFTENDAVPARIARSRLEGR